MKEWLIIVFCVSIIGFMAKMLLPNGKIQSVLNLILSVVSVLAIVKPISSYFNENLNGYNGLYENTFEVDSEYVDDFSKYREDYYFVMANTALKDYGITIEKIQFDFNDNIIGKPLKNIKINYNDIVINENSSHINISLTVKQTLSSLFCIQVDCIELNE